MRADRLREIAKSIRSEPEMFDQSQYGCVECGTPGCVAGWAQHLYLADKADLFEVFAEGREVLDLTMDEAEDLFSDIWPVDWFGRYCGTLQPSVVGGQMVCGREGMFEPNAEQTALALDKFADMGKVPKFNDLA